MKPNYRLLALALLVFLVPALILVACVQVPATPCPSCGEQLDAPGAGSIRASGPFTGTSGVFTGSLMANTSSVTGTSTILGNLRMSGNIANTSGAVTITDNIIVTGTASLNGTIADADSDVTIGDGLIVTGGVSDSDSALTINDDVSITGTLTVAGNLSDSNSALTVADDLTITGNLLNSAGVLTVTDAMSVTGVAYLEGNATAPIITATTSISAPVVTAVTSITSPLITGTTTISAPVVTASTGITITGNNALTLSGSGTTWEDLRIDGLNARNGVVAPTDEVGFRGSASFQSKNLVHNQADEVQFNVQMPHAWREGSSIWPHVHFSPWITSTGATAARFVLDCYWADIGDTFPSSSTAYTMTETWTDDEQWSHLIADHNEALSMSGLTISNVGKCRLYRDNTVANNLAGKVSLLYFDIHYEVDSLGSRTATAK